jgi:catechol 2,3-dioxygenase-like lactoylglutathione lyase family enzyme
MNYVSTRIITDDMKGMVEFYENVTGLKAVWYTDEFAELATPACTLAIASRRTMDMFGAGAARPADNHTAILEFLVDDVDAEYARLAEIVERFIQTPTTQPWGNRSILFHDPDSNLINLFTPVTPQARKKFNLQ